MAKDAAKKREPSVPTELFWACTAAPVVHPLTPTACRIQRGPRAFWIQCGVCKTRTLLAPGLWKSGMGLTPMQAAQHGLTVLG